MHKLDGDSKRAFHIIRNLQKIENPLHYMLYIYLGEESWSKRADETAKNMEPKSKLSPM